MVTNQGSGKRSKIAKYLLGSILLLALLILLFAGYVYAKEQTAQLQVANMILANKNCPLPCWQGIIPGQTSYSQLLGQLKASEKLDESRAWKSGTSVCREVQWQDTSYNVYSSAFLRDNTVDVVTLGIQSGPHLTLGQLIDRFGKPEQIEVGEYLFGKEQRGFRANFYYPRIGTVFGSKTEPQPRLSQATVQRDLQINSLYIFAADSIDRMAAAAGTCGRFSTLFVYRLHNWHGFGEYEILPRTD